MKALIVGGGIAGPVAALAMRKAGIEPEIFEARNDPASDEGAWLTFAGNGVAGLRLLGAAVDVEARGFETTRILLRNGSGADLATMPLGAPAADGAVSISIRRADLYRALTEASDRAGIRTHRGRRLVAIEQTPGGVTARFDDGSAAHGDVLVGADGIRSAARRIIDPHARPARYVPLLTTGGYAQGVPAETAPGDFAMSFGRRGFFGSTAAPDGSVWWFANWPRTTEPSRDELSALDDPELRSLLGELFADDVPGAARLILATPDPLSAWATYDLPRVRTWRRGRVVLIGDAAHAVAPSSGQGASMAIEDGIVLARCLRDIPDLGDALTTYESLRRARVERVVRWGARSSNSKIAGPVGARIRDAMLPLIARPAGRARDEWLFRYNLAWDEKVSESA
jgi:FAD-dependent urate hydroxylase